MLVALSCLAIYFFFAKPWSALAVAKGAYVSLFPLVTDPATAATSVGKPQGPTVAGSPVGPSSESSSRASPGASGASSSSSAAAKADKKAKKAKTEKTMKTSKAKEAAIEAANEAPKEGKAGTPAPPPSISSCFPAAPHRQQPAAIAWRAHDHNVTGISTVPFSGPVSSNASHPSSAEVSKKGGGKGAGDQEEGGGGGGAAVVGGKRRRQEDGGGDGDGLGGGGTGPRSERRKRFGSTALLYTCSMDGSCKEWEVEVVPEARVRGGGSEEERGKEEMVARPR